MSKFGSSKKARFLEQIPTASIDSQECPLTRRCKFNFAYFDKQDSSQDFSEWSADELLSLLAKLKEFSRESLDYWRSRPLGKSGTVLAIYGAFPVTSDMRHPKHVPHEVQWGRFRLDWSGSNTVRLDDLGAQSPLSQRKGRWLAWLEPRRCWDLALG